MQSPSYTKIHTVWARDPSTEYRTLIEGAWSRPEFRWLANCDWIWTEKIDGTNIRIEYNPDPQSPAPITFGGRSNASDIPAHLVQHLQGKFAHSVPDFQSVFPDVSAGKAVILYGEGYGAKIQKGGGLYIPDGVDFILFDVLIGDIWLGWDDVVSIAEALRIQHVAEIQRGPLQKAIDATRYPVSSSIGTAMREGLVMRPPVTLLDNRGRRIITKVKTRDFEGEG